MDEYVKVKRTDLESIATAFRLKMGTTEKITFPGGFREAAGWLPSSFSQLKSPELVLNDDGTYKIVDDDNGDFSEHYLLIAKNTSAGSEEIMTINKPESGEIVISQEMLDSLISESGVEYELSVTAWATDFRTSEASNAESCAAYGIKLMISGGSCQCSYERLYSNRTGYTFTVAPNKNYSCPAVVKVTYGGTEITGYSWDQTKGILTLNQAPTGTVEIVVVCPMLELYAYTLLSDGTYEVRLADGVDPEEPLTLPSVYNGKAVTQVGDFGYNQHVEKITIPSSIRAINMLFSGYSALSEVILEGSHGWLCTIGTDVYKMNPGVMTAYEITAFLKRSDVTRMEARPIFAVNTRVYNGTHNNTATWILGGCDDTVFTVTANENYALSSASGLYWSLSGSKVLIEGSKIPVDSANGNIDILIDFVHEYLDFAEQYSSAWVKGRDAASIPAEILIPTRHTSNGKELAVGYINSKGFQGFEGISKVDFSTPSSIVALGSYALAGCTALSKINLPQGLVRIAQNAFEGDTSMQTILIPESVKYCEENAFLGCDNLYIYLAASTVPSTWNENYNPDNLKVITGYKEPYKITASITNGSFGTEIPETIGYDETVDLLIVPDEGNGYPVRDLEGKYFSVTGCEYIYNATTGVLTLFKPHGEVVIEMHCIEYYNFEINVDETVVHNGLNAVRYPVALVAGIYSSTISSAEARVIKVRASTVPTDTSRTYSLAIGVTNAERSPLSDKDALGYQTFTVFNATGDVVINIKGYTSV